MERSGERLSPTHRRLSETRGRIYPKSDDRPDMRQRQVKHNHGFEVREDARDQNKVKDTILLHSMPDFRGDWLVLEGEYDTDVDLIYGGLLIYDAKGAIDHFAEMKSSKGRWSIRIRRVWLESVEQRNAWPVEVDPVLQVDTHDIALYNDTGGGGCFAGDTLVKMVGGYKRIDQLKIGHETADGRVVAIMQVESQPLFDLKGVRVTADHPVKFAGSWRLVQDIALPRAADADSVYLIETTSGVMRAKCRGGDLYFAAYDGIYSADEFAYQQSICDRFNDNDPTAS